MHFFLFHTPKLDCSYTLNYKPFDLDNLTSVILDPSCLTFLTPVMMSVLVLDGVLDLNFLFFNSLMAVSVTDSTPFIVTTSAVNTGSKASEKHMLMKKTKTKTNQANTILYVTSRLVWTSCTMHD